MSFLKWLKRPGQADLYMFFRIIRKYYSAGISLINSIELYRKNCENLQLQNIMQGLLRDMRNGTNFSAAMRKHAFFPSLVVELMQMAEQTGQTPNVLDRIVFSLEQNKDVRREVNTGLFPAKFFLAGMVVAFCIAIFLLIPKMAEILQDLHTDLPALTTYVLDGGLFIAHSWPLLLLLGIGGIFAFQYVRKTYPEKIDRLKLKIPFFGQVYYYDLQYTMTDVLAMVLQSGIPIQTALRYTAMTVDHIPVRNVLYNAAAKVTNAGISATDALQQADTEHYIHHDFFIMLRAGEESGQVASILQEEADDFRKELLALSKNIGNKVGISVLIPGYAFMILLMFAIYAPLFSMFSAANQGLGL